MIYLSGLVGFLLVLTAEARVGNSSELPFCSETKECLLFDLICKTEDYEVRHYKTETRWVSTNESSFFMELANMRSFRRLFKYITGANAKGVNIDMTSPVVVEVEENKSFWQAGVYTMSFLLPAKYQSKPPKPTDDKVYFSKMRDMKVYVKTYGGWTTTVADYNKAKSLISSLDSVGAKYRQGTHSCVGYNSPMTIFNRHNEVWKIVEDDPVCASSEEE